MKFSLGFKERVGNISQKLKQIFQHTKCSESFFIIEMFVIFRLQLAKSFEFLRSRPELCKTELGRKELG